MHRASCAPGPPSDLLGRPHRRSRGGPAQFGSSFQPFGTLRRRRNELEYPHVPSETATEEEAGHAVKVAKDLIEAATKLIGHLSFFQQTA